MPINNYVQEVVSKLEFFNPKYNFSYITDLNNIPGSICIIVDAHEDFEYISDIVDLKCPRTFFIATFFSGNSLSFYIRDVQLKMPDIQIKLV